MPIINDMWPFITKIWIEKDLRKLRIHHSVPKKSMKSPNVTHNHFDMICLSCFCKQTRYQINSNLVLRKKLKGMYY